MGHFVYMLQSETTGSHYYGSTSDLKQRIISHNSAQNKYTRSRRPWVLKGYYECENKSEALDIELKLKRMKNPQKAYQWLKENGVVC